MLKFGNSLLFNLPKSGLSVPIKCIFSDMDGTLLNHGVGLSQKNLEAIKRVLSHNVIFVPATGRIRKSVELSTGKGFIDLYGGSIDKLPGVFSQGLIVYGLDGRLISENILSDDTLYIAEEYCKANNVPLISYGGEKIYTTKRDEHTDIIMKYDEPEPTQTDRPLHKLSQIGIKQNKLLLIDDDKNHQRHRIELGKLLSDKGTITQAVPRLLEVLPFGASKGAGVELFLKHHGIDPSECMAFGDGENDLEMLRLVKYSIAMDNAKDNVKSAAFTTTLKNTEDGVAAVLNSLVPHN